MEIVAELLLLILQFLIEVAGSALAELGLRSFGEPFVRREARNPVLAAVGYFMFGLLAGGLSLLIFPQPLARSERFHGINLVITPVMAGLTMSSFGRLLEKKGKTRLRLDSFAYGFLFAFAMALVRFLAT